MRKSVLQMLRAVLRLHADPARAVDRCGFRTIIVELSQREEQVLVMEIAKEMVTEFISCR